MIEVSKFSFEQRDGQLCMDLFLSERQKNNNDYREMCISINLKEALKIQDDAMSYEMNDNVNNKKQSIVPKEIENFDKYLSDFVRTVYELSDIMKLISDEEYCDFCLNRLAFYEKEFYEKKFYEEFHVKGLCDKKFYEDEYCGKSFLSQLFFVRYVPVNIQKEYKTVWEMLEAYGDEIRKVVPYSYEEGTREWSEEYFYTDDADRVRRVPGHWKRIRKNHCVAQLKVCLREVFRNESR